MRKSSLWSEKSLATRLQNKPQTTSRGNDDAEVLAFVRHFCREAKKSPKPNLTKPNLIDVLMYLTRLCWEMICPTDLKTI